LSYVGLQDVAILKLIQKIFVVVIYTRKQTNEG